MEANKQNFDKGTPDEIVTGKIKTKAEFPDVGNEPKTESEHGHVPDGKGGAVEAE